MPDLGSSKQSLKNILGIVGDPLGTLDTQIITNKDFDTALNNLIQTTPGLGAVLVDNGTKFVARARPAAHLPLHGNSGGTDIEYSKLEVPGGGSGAVSLTGVLIGTGVTPFTVKANPTGAFLGDSDVQNVTGAKSFSDQTIIMRNPLGTFSGTIQHPAYTANVPVEPFHQFYTYTIYIAGSNIKARNNFTGAVDYVSTTALTTFNSAIQNLKNIETSISGGGIFVKKGSYNLNGVLNLDRADANVNVNNVSIRGEGWNTILNFNPAGALTDAIKVRITNFLLEDIKIQTAVNNITNMIGIYGDGKYGTIRHCNITGHASLPSGSIGINNVADTAATYFWHIDGNDFHQFDKCINLTWVSGHPANAQFINSNNFGEFNTGIYCDSSTNWMAGNFGQCTTLVGDSLIELATSHAFNNNIFGNTVDTASKAGSCCVKLDSGAINNTVIGVWNTGTGVKILDNSGQKNYLNPTSLTTAHADATVGASPYTYTNTDGYIENAIIQGGVVSDISVSRSGTSKTFFSDTDKQVTLFGGDSLIVTYAVIPTVRIFPMG